MSCWGWTRGRAWKNRVWDPGAGLRAIGAGPRAAAPPSRSAGLPQSGEVGFVQKLKSERRALPRNERSSAARVLGPSEPGVIREAAVGGRAMAARGSRRRALRLLLVVQLLAGRWRPAGAARVARGGEPGRGCGSRGRAAGAPLRFPFF